MLSQKIVKFNFKDKKRKNNKFNKLLRLFNIYVSFYLIANAKKYTIIINLNILISELKYKYNKLYNILKNY